MGPGIYLLETARGLDACRGDGFIGNAARYPLWSSWRCARRSLPASLTGVSTAPFNSLVITVCFHQQWVGATNHLRGDRHLFFFHVFLLTNYRAQDVWDL